MGTRYILAMIFGFIFILSGCETTQGMRKDVKGFPQNVAKVWQQAQAMDQWIQKNLW